MIDVIETEQAPKAMGPYAQGRVFNNTIYTAGQIGLDPETMQMVEGAEAQIAQVFSNVEAIVRAGGGDVSSVLKLVVYLTDLAHWPLVNTAMIDRFRAPFPARTAIEVADLPFGAVVEIEAVAAVKA